MTIDEMIAVLQAAKEGKKIQRKYGQYPTWEPFGLEGLLSGLELRVAPEPREFWVPGFWVPNSPGSREACQADWPSHEPILFREVL